MFKSQKYITKGIDREIPLWIQNFIWYAIETMPEPKDYLQVFKLSTDCGKQKIVHTQEVPEYTKAYSLTSDNPITAKIFVIDDDDHCTMLLAEEY